MSFVSEVLPSASLFLCPPTPVGEAPHDQGGVEEDPVFGGLSPPVPIVCDLVRIRSV